MGLLLLKLLFWTLGSLKNLASFVVFRGTATLITLLIQLLRVPSLAISHSLDHVGSLIKCSLEYLLELLMDALASLISGAMDVIMGTATGSFTLATSAIMELVEKTKEALDVLPEIFQEVFSITLEMVRRLILALWNNYRSAVGCITDNA